MSIFPDLNCKNIKKSLPCGKLFNEKFKDDLKASGNQEF